jgi:PAS domain S-box-containing protein
VGNHPLAIAQGSGTPGGSSQKVSFESFEHLFRALIIESGDGLIFAFQDWIVAAANDRACDLYGLSQTEIVGRDLRSLFADNAQPLLERALVSLKDNESWAGEVTGIRASDDRFPVDLTIKRIPLDDCFLICLVIRDLTESQTLKRLLHEEKSHRREMYITMRNLMKAFEKEKSGMEGIIAHRIETLFLPAIERLKREPAAEIRNMYLDILREQLLELTQGYGQPLDGRFLSLTATELKICKWIKKGYSTKEIAAELHLAFDTVQAHRRNIRKKLKIQGRKVNLFAALSSKTFFPQ